jgi:hypothetical protein
MKPINAHKHLSVHLKCLYALVGFYLHCEKSEAVPVVRDGEVNQGNSNIHLAFFFQIRCLGFRTIQLAEVVFYINFLIFSI